MAPTDATGNGTLADDPRNRIPIMAKTDSLVSLAAWTVAAGSLVYPSIAGAVTGNLPSKSEVLAVMNLVADYARHRYPANVEAYWDDGVYHVGMMALYKASRSADVLAYTEMFGDYNNWILDRGVIAANRHNRLAAGQSWIAAYGASPAADIDDTRAEIAAQTSMSLAAVTSGAYFAVDSQFMALPAFAMLGKLDDNSRYFDRLYELFNYANNAHTKQNTTRVYGKLTQRFGETSGENKSSENKSDIKNAYYTLQADYTNFYSRTENSQHTDNLFDYGYVGKFDTHRTPFYFTLPGDSFEKKAGSVE
jgi:hypothetical protein